MLKRLWSTLHRGMFLAALAAFLVTTFHADAVRNRSATPRAATAASLGLPALRVMTYNIRVQCESDGENNWPHRRDMVASVLRFHQADILCLQEAYWGMIGDIAVRLPGYEWYGVGSSDGREAGACNPVFFRSSRLTLLHCETLWLSPSPHEPGRGWDAAYERTVTCVRLRDLQTGRELSIFNVHLDCDGAQAREESARMLCALAANSPGDKIVLGDFNCEAHEPPCRLLAASGFRHAAAASLNGHFGLSTSFNDFKLTWRRGYVIDHILVSEGLQVQQEGIPGDVIDGRLPSDHFPVIAEIAP